MTLIWKRLELFVLQISIEMFMIHDNSYGSFFLINFKTINQVCAPMVSSMTELYHSIQCNISININCKNYKKRKKKRR